MDPLRPSVSRETRLLLTIVVVSLATLWVLARIRFPGRAATPNPVPPVLAQLAPPSAFEDITSTVAQLRPRIGEIVSPILVQAEGPPSPPAPAQALLIRDGLAIAILGEHDQPRTAEGVSLEVSARDPLTGLTLLQIPAEDGPPASVWPSRGLQYPRFLIASDVSGGGLSLRPVFIGSLNSIASSRWSGTLWAVPYGVELRAGTFLFTVAGEFAGLAIRHDDQPAIVPAELLTAAADRLSRQPHPDSTSLGAEVQPLSPTLAAALQSPSGVVVTWVDPAGPAAGVLSAMDVVERVNGTAVTSPEQWEMQVVGLSDGSTAVLDVRRQGEMRQARVIAQAKRPAPADPVLGLTLRTLPKVGAEVLHVLPRSIAARAGVQAGDVITKADDLESPSSPQIARLFAAGSSGGSVVVVLTRGQDHRVLAIPRKP